MEKKLFTSESVTEGHPDKVCDQIADAVLDNILSADPMARVACEVAATTGMTLVFGEISTKHYCDVPAVVRRTLREIGYTDKALGFEADTCAVLTAINEQSPDIARGVDKAWESRRAPAAAGDKYDGMGAGDQGMVFGYASDETAELMPLGLMLAHNLARRLAAVRKSGEVPDLRPDGKTQVTLEYGADGRPLRVDTALVSAQHAPQAQAERLAADITQKVIRYAIPPQYIDKDTKILINPTGRFEVGGPVGDSGLTGRKIVADAYGGYCPHGGGAFSGKDPTKTDRSAAYYARYIAKNLLAAGLAKKIQIQISYAIGVAHPVSLAVNTFGTGKQSDEQLLALIRRHFDPRPAAIIDELGLRKAIYAQTAVYGHFGKPNLPWESIEKAKKI